MSLRSLIDWRLWRWNISPKARVLIAVVAAGGIATMVAIVMLLQASLTTIAAKADQMDIARSNDLVEASVESTLNRMTAIGTDNAQWDDAVDHLYRAKIDTSWTYESWGVVSDDANSYDGAYVVDEHGRILWGYFRHRVTDDRDTALFGSGFAALVKLHKTAIDTGNKVVSGLSLTRYGPAVVTLGLVQPTREALGERNGMRRYLVLTRHITPALVQGMGEMFRLDRLSLTPPGDTRHPYLQLNGADGRTVGHLTWTPQVDGKVAAAAATPKIRQITWLVGLLVLMFVIACGFSLQKLALSEKDARSFALTDGLSGLPNRRALFERLQQVAKARGDVRNTVVFIDLDGFKDVNDIYGHATGDKLIMIVAAALKGELPKAAMLARMGGDEFAMLIGGETGPAQAQIFADAALAFLTAPIRIGDRPVQIGASIGIATANLKTCATQELFRRADMAMYHSKATGKGRITHYDAELDTIRLRKQAIEKGIRDGLARGEFDVAYQPIVHARTQAIVMVEALVRWPRRPEGPLPPDDFIDVAEASGLIHQLGQFVLRKACADLKPVSGIRLSVNISPAQFRDPDFERKVADVLKDTGFPVDRIELEVTEGYLIESPERAIAAVANLKALGVSMALDDFGTGYSSIGYLRRFDFDRIKIDKSLAGGVDHDPQAAALVAGTVSIANALNIEVTAEGVETAEQAALLRLAGCHHLQGFYFSRPKPLAEVVKMLKAQDRRSRIRQA